MGHYSRQLKRRPRTKPRQKGSESLGIGALTAHAGIDLEMHRQRAGMHRVCGSFQLVQLPRLPDHGG